MRTAPSAIEEKWDHITEFSIVVDSGELVIASSHYDPDTDLHISMYPGTYRIRVHYTGLAALTKAYYAGNNSLLATIDIIVWQSDYSPPLVLKRYAN